MEGCIFMSGINALVRGYSRRSLMTFCRVRLQGEVCNLEESPHLTLRHDFSIVYKTSSLWYFVTAAQVD